MPVVGRWYPSRLSVHLGEPLGVDAHARDRLVDLAFGELGLPHSSLCNTCSLAASRRLAVVDVLQLLARLALPDRAVTVDTRGDAGEHPRSASMARLLPHLCLRGEKQLLRDDRIVDASAALALVMYEARVKVVLHDRLDCGMREDVIPLLGARLHSHRVPSPRDLPVTGPADAVAEGFTDGYSFFRDGSERVLVRGALPVAEGHIADVEAHVELSLLGLLDVKAGLAGTGGAEPQFHAEHQATFGGVVVHVVRSVDQLDTEDLEVVEDAMAELLITCVSGEVMNHEDVEHL
ncbi:MAG: hypothetical protein WEB52_11765 [Dehalococcoidia bacterium]